MKFTAAGDMIIQRRIAENFKGYDELRPFIERGDARFFNLETTLNEEGECFASQFSGGTYIRTTPNVLDDIRKFGFNMTSFNNNHALDFSYEGFLRTLEAVEESGLIHAGAGRNLAEASAPRFLETENGRVALIAVNSTFAPPCMAGEQTKRVPGRPGINGLRLNERFEVTEEESLFIQKLADSTGVNVSRNIVTKEGYYKAPEENEATFGEYKFVKSDRTKWVREVKKADLERVRKAIEEAKWQADEVIVSVHSHQLDGTCKEDVSEFLVDFSHFCIDNGNSSYYAIRQSFDGGKTFNAMEEDAKLPIAKGVTNNTVIRFNGNIIYTSDFTSRDGGETWERNMLYDDATPIFILAVSKTDPKLMVGATGKAWNDARYYRSEDGGKSWNIIGGGALGTGPAFDCAEFDVCGENGEDNGDWVWMVKLYRMYHYNIRTGEYTLNAGEGLIPDRFSQIAQNPDNPNHILLGSRPNFVTHGRDNKLSESYDGGKSWHTVPGLWSGEINEITFVPGTTEAFIGTMGGILIYDYEKFNYYAGIQLKADGNTMWVTLPRLDDDGNNVNGGFVKAPEYTFNLPARKFNGWLYKEKLYQPGDKILLD